MEKKWESLIMGLPETPEMCFKIIIIPERLKYPICPDSPAKGICISQTL